MNIDIFVEQWMGPESLDYYYIDWVVKEVKRLRKEINQLPIDLHESLDMILEAHHPEVRESVMAMFGDAWGNNLTGYEE